MRTSHRALVLSLVLPLCAGLVVPVIRWCRYDPARISAQCLMRCAAMPAASCEGGSCARSSPCGEHCPMPRGRTFCLDDTAGGPALRRLAPEPARDLSGGVLLASPSVIPAPIPLFARRERAANARPPTLVWSLAPPVRGPPRAGSA